MLPSAFFEAKRIFKKERKKKNSVFRVWIQSTSDARRSEALSIRTSGATSVCDTDASGAMSTHDALTSGSMSLPTLSQVEQRAPDACAMRS